MRWRVEIGDVRGEARLLQDVLKKLSFDTLEESGTRFLTSDRFEIFSSASDVHVLASRVQSIVREAGQSDPNVSLDFVIASIWETCPNMQLRKHVFSVGQSASLCALSGVGGGVVVNPTLDVSEEEQKRIDAERQEAEYQARLRRTAIRVVSAFRDERARQVQRLFQRELTPQTMGHIADSIQDDIGGAMKNLLSRSQLERFYRSINHPEVFGEHARHIVSGHEPPPNPMNLGEARQFTRNLAERWMEMKADIRAVKHSED